MRLLIVLGSQILGGAERQGLAMAAEAAEFGHDVTLVLPSGDRRTTEAFLSEPRLSTARLQFADIEDSGWRGLLRRIFPLPLFARSWRLLQHSNAELIIFHVPWINRLIAARIAARFLHIPSIAVHQLLPANPPRNVVWRYLLKFLVKHGEQQICVAEHQRHFLSSWLKLAPTYFRHFSNKPAPSFQEPFSKLHISQQVKIELGLPQELRLVCSVGRLCSQKGLDSYLSAIQFASSDLPEVIFIWVGDGPDRKRFERRLRQKNLEKRVILLGEQVDVRQYLRASDLFLLPSLNEGCPVALLEAMAVGLPILCSHCAGNAELIHHEEHGVLFETAQPNGLARALRWALSHRFAMEAMGERAQRKVKTISEQPTLVESLGVAHHQSTEATVTAHG